MEYETQQSEGDDACQTAIARICMGCVENLEGIRLLAGNPDIIGRDHGWRTRSPIGKSLSIKPTHGVRCLR
jgi:hypothetical protein